MSDDDNFVDQYLAAEKRTREFGSSFPRHTGPRRGPNDVILIFLMLGMTWGLLTSQGGILEGFIGAAVGAAFGFCINFILYLPILAFGALYVLLGGRRKAEPKPPRRKTVVDAIDWAAYEAEKKRREAAEKQKP